MSFQTASALLRGRWLLDKHWAFDNTPLVLALLKGDAVAIKAMMDDDDDDDDDDDEEDSMPAILDAKKNVYGVSVYTDLAKLPSKSIAYLDINGPLVKTGGWCRTGMQDYAQLFLKMAACDSIDGIIMDQDSPGGQADGTQTFAEAVDACESVKPVISLVDDGMSASASYWSIAPSTEIYVAKPTDMVGSIGVYCTIWDWYKYYESLNLHVRDVYAPGSEDKNLDFREALAGNDELLKAELKVLRDVFVQNVKTYRKATIKGADWATGKMYFPADAQALGLIDGVKSRDQVIWRITRLISQRKSQNSNSNTMAFEKVLTAAGATQFEVTDNGFVLSEDNLHAVNTALTIAEQTAASLATATAEKIAAEAALATAKTDSDAAAATATTALATANATITSLNAKIVEMGKLDGGRPSTVQGEADKNEPPVDAKRFETSYDREAKKLQEQQQLAAQ